MDYLPAYSCYGVDYTNYETVSRRYDGQPDDNGISSREWRQYTAQQQSYKRKQLQFEREKNEQLERTLDQKILELSDLLDKGSEEVDRDSDRRAPQTQSATNQLHSLSITDQKARYEADRDSVVRLRKRLAVAHPSPSLRKSGDFGDAAAHGFSQYAEWKEGNTEDPDSAGYETWVDLTGDSSHDVTDAPQVVDTWESLNLAAQVRVGSKTIRCMARTDVPSRINRYTHHNDYR